MVRQSSTYMVHVLYLCIVNGAMTKMSRVVSRRRRSEVVRDRTAKRQEGDPSMLVPVMPVELDAEPKSAEVRLLALRPPRPFFHFASHQMEGREASCDSVTRRVVDEQHADTVAAF